MSCIVFDIFMNFNSTEQNVNCSSLSQLSYKKCTHHLYYLRKVELRDVMWCEMNVLCFSTERKWFFSTSFIGVWHLIKSYRCVCSLDLFFNVNGLFVKLEFQRIDFFGCKSQISIILEDGRNELLHICTAMVFCGISIHFDKGKKIRSFRNLCFAVKL